MDMMNWSVDVDYVDESCHGTVSIAMDATVDDALEAYTRLARIVGYSENSIETSILNRAAQIQSRRDENIGDEVGEFREYIDEFTDPADTHINNDIKTWTRRFRENGHA